MTRSLPVGTCLQCGETKQSIKENQIVVCGIVDGYEYRELVEEWERHHWRDWSDRDLSISGLKPEYFDRYRRVPIMDIPWLPCRHMERGHIHPENAEVAAEYGIDVGGCLACFKSSDGIRHETEPEKVTFNGSSTRLQEIRRWLEDDDSGYQGSGVSTRDIRPGKLNLINSEGVLEEVEIIPGDIIIKHGINEATIERKQDND